MRTRRSNAHDIYVREQLDWMDKCGGNLAGYICNYAIRHGRTVDEATRIFMADACELGTRVETAIRMARR